MFYPSRVIIHMRMSILATTILQLQSDAPLFKFKRFLYVRKRGYWLCLQQFRFYRTVWKSCYCEFLEIATIAGNVLQQSSTKNTNCSSGPGNQHQLTTNVRTSSTNFTVCVANPIAMIFVRNMRNGNIFGFCISFARSIDTDRRYIAHRRVYSPILAISSAVIHFVHPSLSAAGDFIWDERRRNVTTNCFIRTKATVSLDSLFVRFSFYRIQVCLFASLFAIQIKL